MKRINFTAMIEHDYGTEEEPNIVRSFLDRSFECSNDKFDIYYAEAQKQSYNGEVTVEDIPDPIIEPTQLDIIEAKLAYVAMMADVDLEV